MNVWIAGRLSKSAVVFLKQTIRLIVSDAKVRIPIDYCQTFMPNLQAAVRHYQVDTAVVVDAAVGLADPVIINLEI